MVKALDSPWRSADRSSLWLKMKPDYVHSADIDAVIIGGYYGSGNILIPQSKFELHIVIVFLSNNVNTPPTSTWPTSTRSSLAATTA